MATKTAEIVIYKGIKMLVVNESGKRITRIFNRFGEVAETFESDIPAQETSPCSITEAMDFIDNLSK